jgi:hypothetical protein
MPQKKSRNQIHNNLSVASMFRKSVLLMLLLTPLTTLISPALVANAKPATVQTDATKDAINGLPDKFQNGVSTILNSVVENPVAKKEIVELLRKSPKTLIKKYFNLTNGQAKIIDQVDDATLSKQLSPLTDAIEKGYFNKDTKFTVSASSETLTENDATSKRLHIHIHIHFEFYGWAVNIDIDIRFP